MCGGLSCATSWTACVHHDHVGADCLPGSPLCRPAHCSTSPPLQLWASIPSSVSQWTDRQRPSAPCWVGGAMGRSLCVAGPCRALAPPGMCRRVLALCSDDCCDLHLARILNYPSFLPRPCLPAPASCTGVKVAPHFDSPFLATSLSNFWAHRWDLVAGNQLRNCVYAPIVEGVLTATERCLLAGHTHLLFCWVPPGCWGCSTAQCSARCVLNCGLRCMHVV